MLVLVRATYCTIGSGQSRCYLAGTNWAGPVRFQIYYGPEGRKMCVVGRKNGELCLPSLIKNIMLEIVTFVHYILILDLYNWDK